MNRALVLTVVLSGLAASQPATAQSETDCTGGTVVYGLAGPTCAMPTPDGGKACTKASDCSGHCMAETMTCSEVTPQFGCFDLITEEGQRVALCVD